VERPETTLVVAHLLRLFSDGFLYPAASASKNIQLSFRRSTLFVELRNLARHRTFQHNSVETAFTKSILRQISRLRFAALEMTIVMDWVVMPECFREAAIIPTNGFPQNLCSRAFGGQARGNDSKRMMTDAC